MLKKLLSVTMIVFVVFLTTGHFSAEEFDASEILQKSNEAMNELESYSIEMEIEQTMRMGEESITMATHSRQDVTLDPFAIYQVTTTSTPQAGEVPLASYWTEDGFYQQNPDQSWTKLENGRMGGMNSLLDMSIAEAQVAQAQALGENMRVEEKENVYRLIFEGDGEELLAAGLSMMESELGENENVLVESILEGMTITDFNYHAEIDKETYYMTGLEMDLNMEMNMEGIQSEVSQHIQMTINNFNGVEVITVPAEVTETAAPVDPSVEEEGGELADTAANDLTFALTGLILTMAGGGFQLIRRRQLINHE